MIFVPPKRTKPQFVATGVVETTEGTPIYMAGSLGRSVDTKPWATALNKALAFAEEKGTRIVGVTGDRRDVGVSLLSNELALAYVQHGINAVLVDASRIDATIGNPGDPNAPFDLLAAARKTNTGIAVVDLAEHAAVLPMDSEGMQQIFERAVASGSVALVIDLPAVHSPNAQSLSRVGPACQLVYLLCLSGVITKSELRDCVESCNIRHVPLGGLIVNDWKQPMARFASTE